MSETSTTTAPKPNFRKGAEAIEEAAKAANRGFQKEHYFGLEDQESCIIRFIDDEPDWINVGQYNFVPTKPAPLGADGKPVEKWPKMMSAVARCDPAFEGIFDDDYIAENIINPKTKKLFKPTPRTWARACLREEVKEDGKVVGYRDKTREVEVTRKGDDGKETTEVIKEKAIVIVNMATKNFFGLLIGFAQRYGTILDRDYYIKRKGDDKDTVYEIVPLDPIGYDLRDPEVAKKYEYTSLEDIVMERASDEYYGRFFDPSWVDPKADAAEESSEGAPVEQQAKPNVEPDADKMAALKERITGYGADDAPSEPEAPSAPSEPQPAGAGGGGMKNFD